ncbi:MAG: replication initiator protein A [Rhizobiales bacterium]|nr:replication initiator protein A [Hyphomicrobiales bacterium]
MEAAQATQNSQTIATEPVYLENTLLRIFGVLFCHDPKRARTRTEKIEINRGVSDKNITVRLDPEYAQPGPFAHKVAMAVIRKQSRFGAPAQKQISFSQRELMRLAGRKTWGGHDSEELIRALRQIRYTHVLAHFKKDEHFVEHDFSIFNEVMIERRFAITDPIVACTVVIADPIIQSLNDKHFTCLNHALMQEVSSIAGAFYMRLFHHFASHYDGKHLDRVSFKKRYDDICVEWLGGLTVLKYKSAIERDQLGTHLDQLVEAGFLKTYAITPAETREGFVLTFRPGARFVADYNSFYVRRNQGDFQFNFHDEKRTIGEPHQLAYLFIEKRTGRKREGIPYVSSKDVETAKDLLAAIPMEQMDAFLNYALSEAERTRFDLQTLGGVRLYLNGYLQVRERRASEKAKAAARQAQDKQEGYHAAYNRYLRNAAAELFNSLTAPEQTAIENLARAKARPPLGSTGYLSNTLFELERTRLTVDRHPGKLLSFDQWKAENT